MRERRHNTPIDVPILGSTRERRAYDPDVPIIAMPVGIDGLMGDMVYEFKTAISPGKWRLIGEDLESVRPIELVRPLIKAATDMAAEAAEAREIVERLNARAEAAEVRPVKRFSRADDTVLVFPTRQMWSFKTFTERITQWGTFSEPRPVTVTRYEVGYWCDLGDAIPTNRLLQFINERGEYTAPFRVTSHTFTPQQDGEHDLVVKAWGY